MQASLPLNEMTITEKLVVMNQIWDDLMRNPDNIPSPEWHKEVLSARAERVKNVKPKPICTKEPSFTINKVQVWGLTFSTLYFPI
jgi:hypothetical protein